jgi:hypothetical protein
LFFDRTSWIGLIAGIFSSASGSTRSSTNSLPVPVRVYTYRYSFAPAPDFCDWLTLPTQMLTHTLTRFHSHPNQHHHSFIFCILRRQWHQECCNILGYFLVRVTPFPPSLPFERTRVEFSPLSLFFNPICSRIDRHLVSIRRIVIIFK